MIINHKYEFVFTHIPKAGGTTMRNYLYALQGNQKIRIKLLERLKDQGCIFSWNTDGSVWIDDSPYNEPTLKYNTVQLETGVFTKWHLPMTFLKQYFDWEYEYYYKFGIVRNPYTRFISSYFFTCMRLYHISPEEFYNYTIDEVRNHLKRVYAPNYLIKEAIDVYTVEKRIIPGCIPQYKFICDKDENVIVDKICKIENFKADVDEVVQKIKLPLPDFDDKKRNKSYEPTWSKYDLLDFELKEKIYTLYKKDFDILSYPAEAPTCREEENIPPEEITTN